MATKPHFQTVIGLPPSSASTSNEMYTLLVDPPLPRFIAWVSLDRFYGVWADSGDRCEVGVLIIYFLYTSICAYSTMIIMLMVIDHGLLIL